MKNEIIYVLLFCVLFCVVFYLIFQRVFLKKNKLILFFSLSSVVFSSLYLYLPLGYSLGVIEDRKIMLLYKKIEGLKDTNDINKILYEIESMLVKSDSLENIKTEKIVLLAEIYDKTNNFNGLAEAYNILIDRFPNDSKYYALYAQSIYLNITEFSNKDSKMKEIMALLDKALTINPNQPLALSIFGMIAYSNKQYSEAISFWDKAIKIYGKSSPESESLIKGIISSQQQINIQKDNLNK